MRVPFSSDEETWVALGLDALGRVLFVVYSWRGESVRLISARKAIDLARYAFNRFRFRLAPYMRYTTSGCCC
jgi:uncharacterized DUF497 family protein